MNIKEKHEFSHSSHLARAILKHGYRNGSYLPRLARPHSRGFPGGLIMATAYLDTPIKTKKLLKERIKAGKHPSVYTMNPYGSAALSDGRHALVGPGPYDRKWYATVEVKDGVIVKVKG